MRRRLVMLLLASATIGPNALAAQTAHRPAIAALPMAAPAENAALARVVAGAAAELIASQASAGFSVAIFREGKPALVRGYGTANFEDRTPVTAETVFRI